VIGVIEIPVLVVGLPFEISVKITSSGRASVCLCDTDPLGSIDSISIELFSVAGSISTEYQFGKVKTP